MINLIGYIALSIIDLVIGKAFFEAYEARQALTPAVAFMVLCGLICFNGFIINFVYKYGKSEGRNKGGW